MLAIKFTVCAAAVLFGLIGPVYQVSIVFILQWKIESFLNLYSRQNSSTIQFWINLLRAAAIMLRTDHTHSHQYIIFRIFIWMTLIQASIAATPADGSGGSAIQQIVPNKETKRIPIGQWSSRKRSGQLSYFKEWSPWGSCDADCRQRRERVCRVLRKCADSKYVEERRCSM